MTKTQRKRKKRKQQALQNVMPEQDTVVGCVERVAGRRHDTGRPPVNSLPSIGASPMTRKSIHRNMLQRLTQHERNDIDSGDRSLDDGAYQFTVDTLRNWDDSDDETDVPNLPMLTKNDLPNLPIPPKSLTRGCSNSNIPQNPPQKSDCAQTHHGFHSGEGGFHFGGYDGGFTVGIEGEYRDGYLERLRQKLDYAQERAKENRKDGKYHFHWLGYKITIDARSVTEGLTFKYQLLVEGVRVLIREKTTKGYQSIRVRFSAESLMANSAPANWRRLVTFLDKLGFIVTKDCISRVDFHLTCDFLTMADIKWLADNDYIVTKLRKNNKHASGLGSKEKLEYLRLGTGSNDVQFYWYNKWLELHSAGNLGSQKHMLTLQAMGNSWVNSRRPVTRFEISVKRDGLRAMGISCVDDLFGNEWAIINLLTQDWVRILDEPKKDGKEYKQKNHPVWDKIRNALYLHFGGKNFDDKAEWIPPEPVACDPEHLEKMTLGCLSKMLAQRNGEQSDEQSSANLAKIWVDSVDKDLHYKINQTAIHTVNKTGIPLGLRVEEPYETIDSLVLERSRKQANDWLASVPTTPLLLDKVTDVPREQSLVRGNGAAVELTATTGLGRFKESMEIIKQNVRLRQLE